MRVSYCVVRFCVLWWSVAQIRICFKRCRTMKVAVCELGWPLKNPNFAKFYSLPGIRNKRSIGKNTSFV